MAAARASGCASDPSTGTSSLGLPFFVTKNCRVISCRSIPPRGKSVLSQRRGCGPASFFTDHVGLLALRFVVGPHQDFAQQTCGEELCAEGYQRDCQDEERPIAE